MNSYEFIGIPTHLQRILIDEWEFIRLLTNLIGITWTSYKFIRILVNSYVFLVVIENSQELIEFAKYCRVRKSSYEWVFFLRFAKHLLSTPINYKEFL